jgi:hypothetical protein
MAYRNKCTGVIFPPQKTYSKELPSKIAREDPDLPWCFILKFMANLKDIFQIPKWLKSGWHTLHAPSLIRDESLMHPR